MTLSTVCRPSTVHCLPADFHHRPQSTAHRILSTVHSLSSTVSKPSTGTPRFALAGAAFVLLAGVVLAFVGMRPPPPRTFQGSVKDLLPPAEIVARDGWKVEYLPIADTPEAKAKVEELLNYDDAVFAVYTRGTERVSIYLAYWTPGKMSHRLVASHTPDVCWVGAGWRIEKAASVQLAPPSNQSLVPSRQSLATSNQALVSSNQMLATSNEALAASPQPLATSTQPLAPSQQPLVTSNQMLATSNQPLASSLPLLAQSPKLQALIAQPGEYREMSLNGRTEHVVFWHLLDGVARSYGSQGLPPWHATITDLFTQAFNQRPEQLFARVSTGVTLPLSTP